MVKATNLGPIQLANNIKITMLQLTGQKSRQLSKSDSTQQI